MVRCVPVSAEPESQAAQPHHQAGTHTTAGETQRYSICQRVNSRSIWRHCRSIQGGVSGGFGAGTTAGKRGKAEGGDATPRSQTAGVPREKRAAESAVQWLGERAFSTRRKYVGNAFASAFAWPGGRRPGGRGVAIAGKRRRTDAKEQTALPRCLAARECRLCAAGRGLRGDFCWCPVRLSDSSVLLLRAPRTLPLQLGHRAAVRRGCAAADLTWPRAALGSSSPSGASCGVTRRVLLAVAVRSLLSC